MIDMLNHSAIRPRRNENGNDGRILTLGGGNRQEYAKGGGYIGRTETAGYVLKKSGYFP